MTGMHMGMGQGDKNGYGDEASDEDGCDNGDEDEGWGWRRG